MDPPVSPLPHLLHISILGGQGSQHQFQVKPILTLEGSLEMTQHLLESLILINGMWM